MYCTGLTKCPRAILSPFVERLLGKLRASVEDNIQNHMVKHIKPKIKKMISNFKPKFCKKNIHKGF